MCQVERESAGAMMRTGFWTAPRRQNQSVEDKFLLAYLLTCPERTSIGLFPLHLGEAAGRTGGDKHQFLTVLDRLVEQREINVEGYWVMVRNWWDHNNRPGPGLRETIYRTLEEAPPALRVEWEAVARAAGIFPFNWKDDRASTQGGTPGATPGTPDEGTGGGSEGPTGRRTGAGVAPGTRGNHNHNHNHNGNSNVKVNTTTTRKRGKPSSGQSKGSDATTDVAAYATILFPDAAAERNRPAFLRVCAELSATPQEAIDLALEFCARNEAGRDRPEFRIQQAEPWMRGVMEEARATGAPILRAGLKYAEEAAEKARRIAVSDAAKVSALADEQRQLAMREQTRLQLQSLCDADLAALADAADALLPRTTSKVKRDEFRALVMSRELPTGYCYAALLQALKRSAESEI